MSFIRRITDAIRNAPPPVIDSPWGQVTESARLQAAINMRLDPARRQRIEEFFIHKTGSRELGLKMCRERYPEAYL